MRAESFIARLLGACEELAVMPFAFGILDRYRSLEIRRRPFRDYLILYRVGPDQVAILRVLHGARDLAALLADAIDV